MLKQQRKRKSKICPENKLIFLIALLSFLPFIVLGSPQQMSILQVFNNIPCSVQFTPLSSIEITMAKGIICSVQGSTNTSDFYNSTIGELKWSLNNIIQSLTCAGTIKIHINNINLVSDFTVKYCFYSIIGTLSQPTNVTFQFDSNAYLEEDLNDAFIAIGTNSFQTGELINMVSTSIVTKIEGLPNF